MTNDLNDLRKTTWRLHPELDVPGLQPPVVLFSLFDVDPRPRFKELLHTLAMTPTAVGQEPATAVNRALFQHAHLKGMWDSLFRDIPGNHISFLYQNAPARRSGKSGRSKSARSASRTVTMLASNDAPGTKFLVTQATLHGNKSICWCVPVTVSLGKLKKVRLTAKNMMVLSGGVAEAFER